MDNLEAEFKSFNNFYDEKIEVEKVLASFSKYTTILPNDRNNYRKVDVSEELENIIRLKFNI